MDLIERQAAIDALKERRDSAKEWYEEASASGDEMILARAESAIMTFVECLLTIKKLPSAQPKSEERKAESVQNVQNEDLISRKAAIEAFMTATSDGDKADWCKWVLERLPSAQPEWNNHTVACMLAELFDDTCACNYNGIDEWLPEKCEVIDACPNPVGVACWEQFLKHRAERRIDEGD